MYFEIQPTENQSNGEVSNKTIDYYSQHQNSTALNPCQTGNYDHIFDCNLALIISNREIENLEIHSPFDFFS